METMPSPTNTTPPTPTTPTTHPTSPTASRTTDPRPGLLRAMEIARPVFTGVANGQRDLPTPCPELDVRALQEHLVFVLRRIAAVGRGESAFSVEPPTDVHDDDWTSLWDREAAAVTEAWNSPAVLDMMMTLPFGTAPGAVVALIYTSELSVHTWDLAQATGHVPVWDDEVLASSLAAMQVGLPADRRGEQVPFDAVVEVAPDALPIERLVAWTGRQPVPSAR